MEGRAEKKSSLNSKLHGKQSIASTVGDSSAMRLPPVSLYVTLRATLQLMVCASVVTGATTAQKFCRSQLLALNSHARTCTRMSFGAKRYCIFPLMLPNLLHIWRQIKSANSYSCSRCERTCSNLISVTAFADYAESH